MLVTVWPCEVSEARQRRYVRCEERLRISSRLWFDVCFTVEGCDIVLACELCVPEIQYAYFVRYGGWFSVLGLAWSRKLR